MLSTTLFPFKKAVTQRLRICQLNTLAHSLKEEESNADFERRTANHFTHITSLLPHIVALEEVDTPRNVVLNGATAADAPDIARRTLVHSKTLPMLLQEAPLSYQFVHYEKTNGTCDCVYLGVDTRYCAIASHEAFRFEPSASQFALVAVVDVLAGGGSLLVVAQHAKAGRTAEEEDTRIDQSRQLITYLLGSVKYASLIAAGRFVWLGDFNAGPHSYNGKFPGDWYPRVVESARTPYKGEGWSNTEVSVESAVKLAREGEEHPYTTFKLKKGVLIKQTIDYIFVSSPSTSLKVVGSTSREPDDTLPAEGFPTPQWGSDHLSVVVDIDVSLL